MENESALLRLEELLVRTAMPDLRRHDGSPTRGSPSEAEELDLFGVDFTLIPGERSPRDLIALHHVCLGRPWRR